jgi:peptidoglycan hydrolase-like protein with peptidoglycan-binding domain
VLGTVGDVFVGGAEAVEDLAKGLYHLVRHPIKTIEGIGELLTKLVTDPKEALAVIGHAFADPYMKAVHEGRPGKALGRGLVEIGSLFITPNEIAGATRAVVSGTEGAFNALRVGDGLSGAVQAATMAVKLTDQAAELSAKAGTLSKLGYADEAAKMAQYARMTGKIGAMAEAGKVGRASNLLKMLSEVQHVRVGTQIMSLTDLTSRSEELLERGARAVEVAGGLGRAASENGAMASSSSLGSWRATGMGGGRAATVVAELPAYERLMQLAGRVAVKSPYLLLSPAAAVTMGRLDSALPDLQQLGTLTPEKAQAIAQQYHLAPDPANVQKFLSEVSSYAQTAVGPGCGTPEQIRQVQAALRVMGYDVTPSGTFDDATGLAIQHFKQKNGLHQGYKQLDGRDAVNQYLDQQTASVLYDKVQAVDKRVSAGGGDDTPLSDADRALAQAQHLAPTAANLAAYKRAIATEAVGPDSTSADTGRIQSLLMRLGYPVQATGNFDGATAQAIVSFKTKAGIHEPYQLETGGWAISPRVDATTELRMRAALQARQA